MKGRSTKLVPAGMEEEGEVFEVFKILARKKNRKGNLEYLVRWKNYGEEDDTWEPIDNLQGCDEALDDFNNRLSKGEAIHFDQPQLKRKRIADSPSRDSVASITSSRGSSPPRTRPTLNGPMRNPRTNNSNRQYRVINNNDTSLKLATHNNTVYNNTIRLRRSSLSLKSPKKQKWEFLSISPNYPKSKGDRENAKPGRKVQRINRDSHRGEENELEDIFLSPRQGGGVGNHENPAFRPYTNGAVEYNEYDDKEVYIPAKRVRKSHSVVGTPLQRMEMSNGGVVIVTGRERMVSISGAQSTANSSGDASAVGLISKFSPVVKLRSINTEDKQNIFPGAEEGRFTDKRKASILARRRLSHTEVDPETKDIPKEKDDRRTSIRQVENLYKYKEIVVKKCSGYTQIRLFTTTPERNALNMKALKELTAALNSAKKDDSKLVFLSGSGSMFCSGLDLQCLRKHNLEERKKAAKHLAATLRTFVDTLISFPKIIVVAVNGPAIGIGAAILPLCDIIYASDKAWFQFPYASLGQTPEGCSSLTIPEVMGMARASEMLYAGRKLTALEACSSGLVSHVFWPTSLMQEVIPRVQKMATGSVKALSMSKGLVRSQLKPKLEYVNERECSALEEVWISADFYRQAKVFLEKGIADL